MAVVRLRAGCTAGQWSAAHRPNSGARGARPAMSDGNVVYGVTMRLFLKCCAAFVPFVAAPAAAQVDDDERIITLSHELAESRITVLATGGRERLDWNGVAVSVFDHRDIEAVQGPDLTRLLERAPGVTLSRNGGAGSFTALRVRGSEADQVLVLVDGVRLADPAAPAAGFDLGTLALGNLAKVELLRSANSTIWGSQAMGGVLAVTSNDTNRMGAALEYGAFDSFYGVASAGLSSGPVNMALSGGWRQSDGFSAAADGDEADGHRQADLAARVEAELTDVLTAFVHARFADARLDLDGFPFPDYVLTDTDEYQDTRQVSGAAGLDFSTSALDLRASYSQADTERQNYDPAFGTPPGYTTDGTSRRAELRGRAPLTDNVQLRFGGEYEWVSFATLFDLRRKTGSGGAYAQLDYDNGPLHLAAGLRRDEHRQFGGEWSLGADGAYELAEGLRLRASYGEGFKAPSLFQLLSDYGNAALRPERARSYDAGLAYERDGLSLAVTAFQRDTRDQIVFESCFGVTTGICAGRPFGTYDNLGRTRAKGIEAEAALRVAEGLNLSAVYALIDTEDRTPGSFTQGNDLARRPRHAATLSADWSPVDDVSLAADVRIVSDAFDDAAGSVALDGYGVVTLRGSWDFSDKVQFYARVENLADEDYQTAAGYAQAGRSAYVGARLRL